MLSYSSLTVHSGMLSLSLQSSAVEQVLDTLMDILSWEIAKVVSPCLPCGLWSHIVIRVFLLLSTVCLRHPPYLVLPSCPLSRAFPYPQPGDAGGRRSAPAVCQSLTSADPNKAYYVDLFQTRVRCRCFACGPAFETVTPSSLTSLKSRMVYLSGAGLPRLSWKKGR